MSAQGPRFRPPRPTPAAIGTRAILPSASISPASVAIFDALVHARPEVAHPIPFHASNSQQTGNPG